MDFNNPVAINQLLNKFTANSHTKKQNKPKEKL